MPKERMTLLDGAILSLIKSFSESGKQFYMSNKEMKKIFASDPGTIQRSIDRLVSMGLMDKTKEYINQRPRRYLTYNKEAVEKFIQTTV
jgi:predicted transcriptional regulator